MRSGCRYTKDHAILQHAMKAFWYIIKTPRVLLQGYHLSSQNILSAKAGQFLSLKLIKQIIDKSTYTQEERTSESHSVTYRPQVWAWSPFLKLT